MNSDMQSSQSAATLNQRLAEVLCECESDPAFLEAHRQKLERLYRLIQEKANPGHSARDLALEACQALAQGKADPAADQAALVERPGPIATATAELVKIAGTEERRETVLVAGLNPDGNADLLPLTIAMTEEQYALGDHFLVARRRAEQVRWDGPFVVFSSDEVPNLARAIPFLSWESGSDRQDLLAYMKDKGLTFRDCEIAFGEGEDDVAERHPAGCPRLAILLENGVISVATDNAIEYPALKDLELAYVFCDVDDPDPDEFLIDVPGRQGGSKPARVAFLPVLDSSISLDAVFDAKRR
jgi:hypothetical protein